MTGAAVARTRYGPVLVGFASLIGFFLLVEVLIRVGAINRYIVPMPSQIADSFERVILEEDIFARFRLTFFESLAAGSMIALVGIPLGILLYRVQLLRLACETWVA
ncbi:MAG TPA: ABC transporter permease, partial [Xanthobacteraceae bacterium]|nr:ABC transporter permease [Xanthobacteraceae bacterium]